MSAVLREAVTDHVLNDDPVVVVGTGPVGIRVAEELLKRDSAMPVVLYGNEPWEPYNRVRLSSLLTGELSLSGINNALKLQPEHRVVQHHNCEIIAIDPQKKTVTDKLGRVQPYRLLVLALGSRPHIPNIEGIDKKGVYTFRNLNDVQKLMARRIRCRRVVVLGGGLLGLEAARGMQKDHTEVYIVEHADRLMARQLDHCASEMLREHMYRLGIHSVLGDSVKSVLGESRVTGIQCRSGREIECDTLIVATGIRSNIEVARHAGLSVGRGIRVSDHMQTSNLHIYAVGECAEHRDQVYGLVVPGLEQAAVAAHNIVGGLSRFTSSLTSARLKVLGVNVFSMGRTGDSEPVSELSQYIYRSQQGDVYRKLLLRRGTLVGMIAYGDWSESNRIQEAIETHRFIWPWQRRRFMQTGYIWPASDNESVHDWPATATVCQCTSITRGALTQAIKAGHRTVAALRAETGASSVCGSCRPLLSDLTGKREIEPEPGNRALVWSGAIGLLLALAIFILPAIPYADSVQFDIRWDALWRNELYKQLSGFGLLAIGVLISFISLRKRLKHIDFGAFSNWRLIHVVLGAVTALILTAHTGFRLGHNLNLLLMLCFSGLLLVGSIASGTVGLQHALPRAFGKQTRELSLWLHIALLFPLPALLSFHILKTYWF